MLSYVVYFKKLFPTQSETTMERNLRLVVSNPIPASVDPNYADGYVAYQLYSRNSGVYVHEAGTRLSKQLKLTSLITLWDRFHDIVSQYNGKLEIRTMPDKDIVVWFSVPTSVSEDDFMKLLEQFKEALKIAEIITNPLDCKLKDGLRSV